MYILVLLFPLTGFLLSGLFGFYFGRVAGPILSTLGLFLTLLSSLFIFYEICICHTVVSLKIYN
jgi:NADH:ubiquinone oxidoreductase subunit 5 (subunit L)/multisubunit Na+/H+ antiporter MnhA subunit